ncbi:MAG: LysE family transporter [Bacteroidetes bacterium]|nr:LysE family transporter [Bacteroidota bacterium]
MLQALWQGFLLGFGLAFLIGPVFFLILFTSLNRGFKPAAYIATGVMISDAVCIIIAQLANKFINQNVTAKFIFGLAGGIILVAWGAFAIFKKVEMPQRDLQPARYNSKTIAGYVLRGFAANTFNPFALIFWIGVVSAISLQGYDKKENYLFFATSLATVLATDIAKSYLANYLNKFISTKALSVFNKISGVALILFGLQILWKLMN